jgi:folylpolyglutamate synthase/dihydropteroate synthase
VLVGLSQGKDYQKIADIIKSNADFIGIVDNFSEKRLPADKLQLILKELDTVSVVFDNIEEGYFKVKDSMNSNDILLIIGSHYLIGEFFKKIQNP